MNTFASERRAATRLEAHCDAEVFASLTILDNDAAESDDQLIFCGKTTDLSLEGLGVVLPSAPIDERFCNSIHQITVRLHLPHGPANLQFVPARCVSLGAVNVTGYLVAGRIVSSEEQYANYLKTLTPHAE